MLLRALKEFEERSLADGANDGGEPELPPFYANVPVRYVIPLEGSGRAISRTMEDTAVAGDKQARRGGRMAAPQVVRSSGVKPLLLADKADYVLGYVGEDGNPVRAAACRQAFLELTERCVHETGSADVAAVLAFLRGNPLGELDLTADFDPGATITFTVDGRFPIQEHAVQQFWAAQHDPAARGGPVMQCVVCGERRAVVTRLPGKVKGIPGGQTSGTALISANAPAFESYGLQASLVAPTCSNCAETFTRGLNRLLADERTRVFVGPTVFAFWTRRPTTFEFRSTVVEARPEAVATLMQAIASGGRYDPAVEPDAFYAAVLSGSGGRAVVREWIDTTVGRVKANALAWFARQSIVDAWADNPRPLGLFALAMTTVREPRDLSPGTTRALLRAAVTGGPLPWAMLEQVIRRCRAEQNVDRPHAAAIRLVMLTRGAAEGEVTMALRTDHPSVAYHCGRLLAVLESAQRAALGDVGAGIIDRFYGTASSAPVTVFPTLLRGAQAHLGKLERDRPAAWHAIQDRLTDVLERVDGFPTTLTIADQGLFALGFYHQRADDRTRARAAAERKRQGSPAPEPAEIDAQSEQNDEEVPQ